MKRQFFVSDAVRAVARSAFKKDSEPGSTSSSDKTHEAIISALDVMTERQRKNTALLASIWQEPTAKPTSLKG